MTPVSGTPHAPLVGNDVVDLSNPRVSGKEKDARFLDRVFSADERRVIGESSDPSLELWGMWAAKEAAFKIVSKRSSSPPPFVHRAFAVAWEALGRRTNPYGRVLRAGRVRYLTGHEVLAEITRVGSVLAALACPVGAHDQNGVIAIEGRILSLSSPEAGWARDPAMRDRLTPAEAESVHSPASAAVRVGARAALARDWGVEDARIEIVCDPGPTGRRPPRVMLDGATCGADVSLAHDGPWIAWAYAYAQRPVGL
jgi:phosphopantetheine--protein transferase-like protein